MREKLGTVGVLALVLAVVTGSVAGAAYTTTIWSDSEFSDWTGDGVASAGDNLTVNGGAASSPEHVNVGNATTLEVDVVSGTTSISVIMTDEDGNQANNSPIQYYRGEDGTNEYEYNASGDTLNVSLDEIGAEPNTSYNFTVLALNGEATISGVRLVEPAEQPTKTVTLVDNATSNSTVEVYDSNDSKVDTLDLNGSDSVSTTLNAGNYSYDVLDADGNVSASQEQFAVSQDSTDVTFALGSSDGGVVVTDPDDSGGSTGSTVGVVLVGLVLIAAFVLAARSLD
ncbi:hypothetical protein ACFQE1_02155 [Halobium palmae]|uniref:PGF-CTERM protein n=1 Tax=Halobium palmae TaxID=1776492 RepID=A0ABD5RVG1_9EURY